jgi:hypothetical protein
MSTSTAPTAEATRLRAIIETQQLINAATLDPGVVMRVVAERAQLLTEAAGGIVELLDGDEMVYRTATGSVADQVGLRLGASTSLSGLCVHSATVLRATTPRPIRGSIGPPAGASGRAR